MDDLFHFMILVVLVLCCFAAIGVWRFGAERSDFATFAQTLYTSYGRPPTVEPIRHT